jgi:hypothetical protein
MFDSVPLGSEYALLSVQMGSRAIVGRYIEWQRAMASANTKLALCKDQKPCNTLRSRSAGESISTAPER